MSLSKEKLIEEILSKWTLFDTDGKIFFHKNLIELYEKDLNFEQKWIKQQNRIDFFKLQIAESQREIDILKGVV